MKAKTVSAHFWLTPAQKKEIKRRAKKLGFRTASEYLRDLINKTND